MTTAKRRSRPPKTCPACRACLKELIDNILAPNAGWYGKQAFDKLDSGDMSPLEVAKRILTVKLRNMDFLYADKCVSVVRDVCKMARDAGCDRSLIDDYEQRVGHSIWSGGVHSQENTGVTKEVAS
jgi:hypothetical protein